MAKLNLQICVFGCYFTTELYETLTMLDSRYRVLVVANPTGDTRGLPSVQRENTGLEFGAYAYFVDRHWNSAAGGIWHDKGNHGFIAGGPS